MQRYGSSLGLSAFGMALFLISLGVVPGSVPALAAARQGDPLVGRKLYMTHCYTCHGVTGRGDGPAAARLEPKPRNLTDDAYLSKRTDQDLSTAISGGSPAVHRFSEMPEWKNVLYPERIRDIVAYIRTLHRPFGAEGPSLARPGNVGAGKRIFTAYCAVCHGAEGRGDGPVTGMFGPKPFDFADKVGMAAKRDRELYEAIFGGGEAIGKSPFMPRWAGLLKEQEIWDVIAYVHTLSRP